MIRQPLLHFLLLGGLLFLVDGWLLPDDSGSERRVTIDEAVLLEYLQYRGRSFDSAGARARLAGMGPAEREALIERVAREEVLFREAQRLGLDQSDYVVKQRLVQKLEYLARDVAPADDALSEAEVIAFYEAEAERYRQPPSATFAHVFVRGQDDAARERAASLHERLRREAVPFEGAMAFGDRFPYHVNYIGRSRSFISSHFGDGFADALFARSPQADGWSAPLASEHGLHLVKVRELAPGGLVPLADIRDRVAADARRAAQARTTEERLRRIMDSYEVEYDLSTLDAAGPVAAAD